jgi:hypothetical protein
MVRQAHTTMVHATNSMLTKHLNKIFGQRYCANQLLLDQILDQLLDQLLLNQLLHKYTIIRSIIMSVIRSI